MKNLRLFFFVSSTAVGLAGALVACSSDDVIVSPDGGTDSDAGGQPDATQPVDGGAADTGPDVITDAGLKVETYADQVADTICNALTRCCFGNSNVPEGGVVDGGTFDRGECLRVYATLGFESSNLGLATTQQNVQVNQAKGAECIAKINSLMCELSGTSLREIRSACFSALEGQLQNGAPCRTSLECASGLFCLPSDGDGGVGDGGIVGACAPLRKAGENCSIQDTGDPEADSVGAEIACSWRGGGDTNLRCASYDIVSGAYKTDRLEWTCEPAVANGAFCNTTVSCADGICDPGEVFDKYTCEPVLTYFNKFSCEAHIEP